MVAAAAAARLRLATHPCQATAKHDEEAAVTAQCFLLLEDALEAVWLLVGGGCRPFRF